MKNQLNKAIVSTLAFYDAVAKAPLTKIELYRHLLKVGDNQENLSLAHFFEHLENNCQELSQYITRCRGFYFLKSNRQAYERRIHIGKTGIKKWRRAKNMARIIVLFPSVQMVGLTGSLALNNTHAKSDIDMLVVARAGSIWTTRLLVSLVMHLLGKRRYGTKIADRICLNHYITDDSLALRPKHLFSAHICATLVPLEGKSKVFRHFIDENASFIKLHFPNFFAAPQLLHLKMSNQKQNSENASQPRLPSPFEYAFKTLQMIKIKHGASAQGEGQARLDSARQAILDDQALVFHHPRPQDQEALYLHEKNLQNLFTDYPHMST